MNYYFPISTHLIKEIHIANDMVDNDTTHNYIRPFVQHNLSNGLRIRYSEIQYEGIGLTLIDLENSTYKITEGFNLNKFLTGIDKLQKVQLYRVPVLTPTVLSQHERAIGIPVEGVGADLLLRQQRIVDFIKSMNKKQRDEFMRKYHYD
ncbi:hypothetical protein [Pseudolactococcus piscium]|uniref:hypothetical protein n=1 Tax=Pseudolactococcus piscium TaxID=1364 RepID=UPI0015CCB66F|nr:hypothetical protein [Lactococcus piscium]